MRTTWAALAAFLLLASTNSGFAQGFSPDWNRNRGVDFGFQLHTNIVDADDPSTTSPEDQVFVDEVGVGAMFHVGYTFSPPFALRFAFGGARHETTLEGSEVVHATGTIEAHYRFLPEERVRPYLMGGLGGSTLLFSADDLDSEVVGTVAVFGAGLLYGLTRNLLLDFSTRLDLINWQEVKLRRDIGDVTVELTDPVDEDGSSVRFLLGLAWQL